MRTIEAPSPPHRFGDRGDVVIPIVSGTFSANGFTGDVAWIGFSHDVSGDGLVGGRQQTNTFFVKPELDVFVARHFSVGGTASFSYFRLADSPGPSVEGESADATTVMAAIAPRLGYAFTLGDRVTIWPRVGGGIAAYDSTGNLAMPQTPFVATASLDMPIIYAFDRHLYVSIDPTLSMS
ncbi:MAG: hypothetical protein ACREJX_09395, partial [Polyangiaceae bacterium]